MKLLLTIIAFIGIFTMSVSASAFFWQTSMLVGTVQSINEKAVTVLTQDGASKEMVELQLSKDTQFEEGSSMDKLHKGDHVQVKYKEDQNQKVLVSIVKVEATAVEPSKT